MKLFLIAVYILIITLTLIFDKAPVVEYPLLWFTLNSLSRYILHTPNTCTILDMRGAMTFTTPLLRRKPLKGK